MPSRKTAVAATVAVAAVVVALLLPSGESDGGTPPVPVTERAPLSVVPVPEPPAVDVPEPPAADVRGAAAEPGVVVPAPLCEGCLDEQGVLDVAEGLLSYIMPNHLSVRAVPYATEYPPGANPLHGRPLLTAGLVDAPPDFSMGKLIVGRVDAAKDEAETWIVWVQTGWLPYAKLEDYIERGELPEVARSWPPLKEETYVLINARTGELTGLSDAVLHLRDVDPTGTNLILPGIEEATKRAEAWFAANRTPGDEAGAGVGSF